MLHAKSLYKVLGTVLCKFGDFEVIKKRAIHTSSQYCRNYLDSRDPDKEKKEEQLTFRQEEFFNQLAKKRAAHDKNTFQEAIKIYDRKEPVYRRGHVEFIYASLNKLKEFGVHRDLEIYRQLIGLFPKEKMVVKTMWQAEFMHYPKQQQCCIDVLDKMEESGVIPDDEMGRQLISIFGQKSHVFRKYQRMMYWLPKFKYANPFFIPRELPDCRRELGKLAVRRMCRDLQTKIDVYEADELDTAVDQTFIVNGQCPDQRDLLAALPTDKPVFVEGGYSVWLRHLCMKYFILRSEVTPRWTEFQEKRKKDRAAAINDENGYNFDWDFLKDEGPEKAVAVAPTIHEQEDGTILAVCVTGTSSKDSLMSWIKFLEKDNPKLAEIPVVFLLQTPEEGVRMIDGDKPYKKDMELPNSNLIAGS